MIDTIVLTLSKAAYSITDPDKFKPSVRWLLEESGPHKNIQSKQNPTKRELLLGIYKPRLTLFSHVNQLFGHGPVLRIELSLPKLFFGNNFSELQVKDFLPLAKQLVAVLADMGVQTTTDALAQTAVSVIHYSKNIALTDGSTPYHYIQKIKEANIQLSLDTNQTDYRNEGHSYKWHSNSYEVVFYDKIKDLEKARVSEKRALEKDNALQLHLFKPLQKRKKFEILRMEVRLNTRKKIKQLFSKLGINADLTFKKLFKPAISKRVLLHYLDEIENKRPLLLDYTASDEVLLTDLILNNPNLSQKQILQFYGLKQALCSVGVRELRAIFAAYGKSSWYRLMADAEKVRLSAPPSPLRILREQLVKFKPLKH